MFFVANFLCWIKAKIFTEKKFLQDDIDFWFIQNLLKTDYEKPNSIILKVQHFAKLIKFVWEI